MVLAFCFEDEKHTQYLYSMVRSDFQKAFTIKEVAKLIRRPHTELQKYLKNKVIDRPSGFSYNIQTKQPRNLLWSQDDVLDLRDRVYELTPKAKDGFPSPRFILASKAEVMQKMNNQASYFVRTEDGEYKKVWRAV